MDGIYGMVKQSVINIMAQESMKIYFKRLSFHTKLIHGSAGVHMLPIIYGGVGYPAIRTV
jgi:hypothetical protein